MLFQDKHFYYLRKPAGWNSTRGKEECFLNKLENGEYEAFLQAYHHSDGYDKMLYGFFHANALTWDLELVRDVHALIHYLLHTFSHTQEYGLVNRLDRDTAGFLYFAKDVYNYTHYKKWQNQGWIKKNYLAMVRGDIGYILKHPHLIEKKEYVKIEDKHIILDYPMMHHGQLNDRMIVVKSRNDMAKGRGKVINKTTKVRVLDYNHFQQRSLVHVEINQGARHQIRNHLGVFGYPLLGEKIYAKKGVSCDWLPLHLWSIGCSVEADHEVLKSFYKIWEKMNEPIHIPGDHSQEYC